MRSTRRIIVIPILTFIIIGSFMLADMNQLQKVDDEIETGNVMDTNLIEDILHAKPLWFDEVLANIDHHEVQILYTQIDRQEDNTPVFTSFAYRLDARQYFYPASAIKLSACALALEKLNHLNIEGLNKYTPLKFEMQNGKYVYFNDGIAGCVKRTLLLSENSAFNALYDFLGYEYFNQTLWKKGYLNSNIIHRLTGLLSSAPNGYTHPAIFYQDNNIVYTQPSSSGLETYFFPLNGYLKGTGHINFQTDEFSPTPYDFSRHNYMSLEDMHNILKAIIFPEYVSEKQRFDLTEEDYALLRKYMVMTPQEGRNDWTDDYTKFFMINYPEKSLPKNIKIWNKSGIAFGYMVDNAYIADPSSGIEFLLTAVIHSNENGVYGDDHYEYQTISRPFLANLGKAIYEYEQFRKHPIK